MKSSIIIKGNKYGFQIVLNPTVPFETLVKEVEEKFVETDRFFDESRAYAVSFEGRSLTPGEQNILVDTITGCCRLNIGYIIDGAESVETAFATAIAGEKGLVVRPEPEPLETGTAEAPYEEAGMEDPEPAAPAENVQPEDRVAMNGQFYRGTLRSGQTIEVPGSIVILGDINPGAQVIAGGNVVVLGCLKGIVNAGYPADRSAIVVSLLMDPMQIQIGEFIARAPDETDHKKRGRKKKKTEEFSPKIAFIEDNNIIIDSISRELINEMSNI